MNRRSRTAIVAAALLLSAPFALAAGLLDGKVFVGDIGPVGKPADEKGDVISFADGKFHSSVCDQWGYTKAGYQATRDGDAIRFEATTSSDSSGKLHWRGTLVGGTLEGRITHHRKPSWWRPNPEPLEQWFKAVAKQP